MSQFLISLIIVVLLALPVWVAAASEVPRLMLAQSAPPSLLYGDYLVSEKFDGVRGYWNGHAMLTRSGRTIELPNWFAQGLADQIVEGELWLGRGRFDELSALVRRNDAQDPLWQQVTFKAFDLPAHKGRFAERAQALTLWAKQIEQANIQAVEHMHFSDADQATQYFNEMVADGAEGLMLNKIDATYQAKRTSALLKLKPSWDDEAKVIGYTEGQGKYQGMVGALIVKRADGLEFKIGSGLSDAQRQTPPPIGRWVTYAYSGFTVNGVPRFARFIREYDPL